VKVSSAAAGTAIVAGGSVSAGVELGGADGAAVAAAAAAAAVAAAVPEIGADISDTRLLALPCLRK
jgi:hypothetical protein